MAIFYHPIVIFFVKEEISCHRFEPRIDIGTAFEHAEPPGIIRHEMSVQLVYQLIIIGFMVENIADDAVKQRLAPRKEEVRGDFVVTGNQALDDFLVGHKRTPIVAMAQWTGRPTKKPLGIVK